MKCRVNAVATCSYSESEEWFLGYIYADINTVDTEWNKNIEINDNTIRFHLDTGAKSNVLPLRQRSMKYNRIVTNLLLQKLT